MFNEDSGYCVQYVRIRALISRFDLSLASLCEYRQSSWQTPDAPFGDTSLSFGGISLPFAVVMFWCRGKTSKEITKMSFSGRISSGFSYVRGNNQ